MHMAKKRYEKQKGFTFVELLIAMVAGTIVVMGIFRLFTVGLWSYNLQESQTDLYQNATYAIQRLNEAIVQVGSNLPEKNYQVVFFTSSNPDSLTMRVNLNGGRYQFTNDSSISSSRVSIADARGFIGADSLISDSVGNNGIDVINHYKITKVDTTPASPAPDTITLATSASFRPGTVIFASATRSYYYNSNTLWLKDSVVKVMSENIDSLSFVFYKRDGLTVTTVWDSMMIASVYVRARAAVMDPKYKNSAFGNDGYRRLPMAMTFRLRNRF